jgi:hypothetical protein
MMWSGPMKIVLNTEESEQYHAALEDWKLLPDAGQQLRIGVNRVMRMPGVKIEVVESLSLPAQSGERTGTVSVR